MDCNTLSNGTVLCEQAVSYWGGIQTAAIVVSAAAAIWMIHSMNALAKVRAEEDRDAAIARAEVDREVSRRRATVDLVLHQKRNLILVEAEKEFYKLEKAGVNFTAFACDSSKTENNCIIEVLNNHEFVASGLKDGAFDEESYKRMMHSIVTKDWELLKAYVTELRSSRKHHTLFQEFEWLAEKWKADPLKPNK
ncbi:MAG: DUF4760 domain-containing protein [Gallionellaceae bacterium]